MSLRKITEADLQGKGNVGKADTPGVSTAEMQRILDELPREVIVPAVNELAEQLEAETAAANLGAEVPGAADLPEDTPHTVQGVLSALLGYIKTHLLRTDNPHGVTAAQAGAYTKAETQAVVDQKIVEVGAGDMAKATYDPQHRETDVFEALATAAGEARAGAIAAALAADIYVYTGRLLVDGWTAGTDEQGTACWTQTVAATSRDGGPPLTASTQLFGPMDLPTGVQATDEILAEVLRIVNDGTASTGEGTVTCKVWELPEADAQIYWPGKAGGTT